jgi:hypothetical protein
MIHDVFFIHLNVQDVLDWVNWFKVHRSSDITTGITKVRQLTFQMVQTADSGPQCEAHASAAGGVSA